MNRCFYICTFFIVILVSDACFGNPAGKNELKKEEIISINSTKIKIRLWTRFLRNATLQEIHDNMENNGKGNSATAITFHCADDEEQLAGIYYYNYFPNFYPNTEMYSSFFWDHSSEQIYWIIVDYSPPFKFHFFIYILPFPFKGIGIYPNFVTAPINAWPQPTPPITQYLFSSNGYGDFLLDDLSFNYDFASGVLVAELRDKKKLNIIRVSYDFNQKQWNCTKPIQTKPSKPVQAIDNDKSKRSQRGLLDPLPPEEMERRKREFLASQPLKELFSAAELEKLFTEPDYIKISDPLQLALAYDWAGKYQEAQIALEKATGLEAQFELGCFLKHGRPKIPADKTRANELFSKVVMLVEAKSDSPSGRECCLAGRACSEYIPENWDENVRWQKRAAGFFRKAIEKEYRPAYYYLQYYARHSSGNNPKELMKALPSDNPEVNAFIAALAGMNSHFKEYRNRDKNLAAIKEAIQAHNNVAQCALGMLYLVSDTDPNAFLLHNQQKAKFWLQRAADRGDMDAAQLLQSDSRLKNLKK